MIGSARKYLDRNEVEAAAISPDELPANFPASAEYWNGESAGFVIARYCARKAQPIRRPISPQVGTPYESDWWAGFDAGTARFERMRGDAR